MRIEDHWEDGFLYYVEFQVKQGGILRIIRKHIVFYEEKDIKEVEKIIYSKFKNVVSVKSVEFHEDILLIKN